MAAAMGEVVAGAGAAPAMKAPEMAAPAAPAPAIGEAFLLPPKEVPGEFVVDDCEAAVPQVPQFNLVDWCDSGALDLAAPQDNGAGAGESWFVRNLLGFAKPKGVGVAGLPKWACAVFGVKPGYWASVAIAIPYVIAYGLDRALTAVIPSLCGAGNMAPLYFQSSVMGFAERWIGTDFGPARQSLNQQLLYNCPQTPQGPSETIPAYLHGMMTKDDAVKWNMVVGWCPDKTELAIDAARWRPSPQDIVTWRNWQCLSGMTTPDAELKKIGMIDATDRDNYLCASHTPLNVGEIYRLLHEAGPAQPDREVKYSESDARQDLKRLGYSDRDIPFMLFLARTPLGHRQLLQPFLDGSITENILRQYLIADGFDQTAIDDLMPHYKHQRTLFQMREAGLPSVAEASRAAAAGEATPAVWGAIVQKWDVSPQLYTVAGQVVEFLRQQNIAKESIAAVRAGFNAGEISSAGAQADLQSLAVDPKTARDLVQEWELIRSSKLKPVGAAQLCTWHGSGLVSTVEFAARLTAMGYSNADATRIVAVCVDAERRKVEKAAEQAAAARQRQEEKVLTAEQKAAKEARAAQARAQLAAARAKLAIQRAEVAAIKGDLSAASKVGSHTKGRESELLTGKLTGEPGPLPSEVSAPVAPPSSVTAALELPPA